MTGKPVRRTRQADPAWIMAYMRNPKPGVNACKGRRLTRSDWDWQLRQSFLLSNRRNLVSIFPQPAFPHQVTALDTLGIDRTENTCKLR